MIKLLCFKCGATWFTANTKPNQKCSCCGAKLREVDFTPSKEKSSKQSLK